ncbi:MAG: transposase, partial [Acidocella sp.]|nr:transposase [Acidocella sp.]
VEESFTAGVSVAAVARRNGVAPSLVFAWRDQAKSGHLGGSDVAPMLVPVTISASDPVPHQGLTAHNPPLCSATIWMIAPRQSG